MKIVFNGVFEKIKKGGCNCKKVGNTGYGFATQKMYILPSGQTKTFIVGVPEEVSPSDGRFLLSYKGVDVNGSYREIFSKVE